MEKLTKKKKQRLAKQVKISQQVMWLTTKGYLKLTENGLEPSNMNDKLTSDKDGRICLNVHRATRINNELLNKLLNNATDMNSEIVANANRQASYPIYQRYRVA